MQAMTPPKSRNDLCPCGSGKRYKACHGAVEVEPVSRTTESLQSIMGAALRAQTSGDLIMAEQLYEQALVIDPNQADCLHMLGVVNLQKLDLFKAKTLIERAGELVGWIPSSFRHNYGHVLSSFLSAREPANLRPRQAALAQQRERLRLSRSGASDFCAIVIAPGAVAMPDAVKQTFDALNQMFAVTARPPTPGALILMSAAASASTVELPTVHRVDWSPTDVVGCLSRALSSRDERYVVVLHAGDVVDSALLNALADLSQSGARWGVARGVAQVDAPGDFPPAVLENAFSLLQHSTRVGAALFADSEPMASVGNVMWERRFLLELLSRRPANFQQLCELAIWDSEPVFVNHVLVRYQTRIPKSSAFWDRTTADVEPYLALALGLAPAPAGSGEAVPNPVAPSLEQDGPSFLKRALRLGLGTRMSPDTLRTVAELVTRAPGEAPTLSPDGLELIGFVRAENGLGESLRLLARSCLAVNLPIGLTNIPLDMGMPQTDTRMDTFAVDQPTYRTRLICTNPDSLGEGNFVDGAFALPTAYNIGYWYWELENLPATWANAGRIIDELWVATEFVANAARKRIDKPVVKITPPITQPKALRQYSRAEFGLPPDAFVFMFSFDFGSFPARKNPEAVVRAFKLAFPTATHALTERGVRLVIKCQRAHTFPAARAALLAAIGDDTRIILLDRSLPRDAVTGLQTLIDCYVSLHRSEGLGLGMAECMALGKPVIATAYSGNMEFMNEDNSLLVDYSLTPVNEGEYLDWRDQRWADANVGQAASHMRRVFDDRKFSEALGRTAQQAVLTEFSPARVGERIRRRLDQINSTHR